MAFLGAWPDLGRPGCADVDLTLGVAWGLGVSRAVKKVALTIQALPGIFSQEEHQSMTDRFQAGSAPGRGRSTSGALGCHGHHP